MNLTVRMRIISGFAVVSALLIIISATALLNLKSVKNSTDEINDVAVPTLSGSNALKASFLMIGRTSFEAYIDRNLDSIESKHQNFKTAQQSFESEYATLESVLDDQPELSSALSNVKNYYDKAIVDIESMYKNHIAYMNMGVTIENRLIDVEDNSDDASTYLLDFADMDEVQSNTSLQKAAELGSNLESQLLSLMTVSSDYINTKTLIRADTIGNEVKLTIDQINQSLLTFQRTANGQDTSGTVEEISDLVAAAISAVSGNEGILALHKQRLNYRNNAELALKNSDQQAASAITELENLLELANERVHQIESEVSNSVSSSTTWITVIVLASLCIAIFIGLRTVTAITKPLSKVNSLLNIASSGDLTHSLDDSAQDEFGQLSRNCNTLIGNLKSLIAVIHERAEQLSAAAEQTSAVTLQATNSIQDQKSQISHVAAATTEMHSTSQLVTQSADDTLEQIRSADEEAKNVRAISVDNKSTIEVLAKDVEEAAQVINKLHQDSASIGGILDVIRGVADQTNLLALNAAIEAARAGEQGRGFAVVADEVRTLASRTQESTQEINAMIEVLQAGAEKAVSVMNQGKEQTALCVEQSEKATQAIDVISQAVHNAHDVSSQIEQSAKEQNIVSQEISKNLETIVGIAEETAIGSQQTSESSQEVARLAEELQESVRQFRV